MQAPLRGFKWAAVAALLVHTLFLCGFAQQQVPNAETNFGVHIGLLKFLPQYVFNQGSQIKYRQVIGKATMTRLARTGATEFTVSFAVSRSSQISRSELASSEFVFRLHNAPCDQGGGTVYQNPYLCPNGCTSAQVAAAQGSTPPGEYNPLELTFTSFVDTFNFNEAHFKLTWDVHIPEYHNQQLASDMSLMLYDPDLDTPMACADLIDDRRMEGQVFTVYQQDSLDQVPVINARLYRHETGFTTFSMRGANLRSEFTYKVYVHALPCLPITSSSQPVGGDRFMRNISCYGAIGSSGCEAIPSNQLSLTLTSDNFGVAESSVQMEGLASADAQSVLLHDCFDSDEDPDSTGTCAGEEPIIMCIDLVDEIPPIASSSAPPLTNAQPSAFTKYVPRSTQNPLTTEAIDRQFFTTSLGTSTAAQSSNGDGAGGSYSNSGDFSSNEVNPCPSVLSQHRVFGEPSKKNARKMHQLDFSPDGGMCCLGVEGPSSSLVSITLLKFNQFAKKFNTAAIVAGVAGGVLVAGGIALVFHRKRQEIGSEEEDEPEEYAVPSHILAPY